MKDVPREVDILAIAGRPGELYQGHLNLWMPRHDGLLVCTWSVVRNQKIIYESNAGIEQGRISRCPIVCNRSLQHMADAIQFVPCRLGVVLLADRFVLRLCDQKPSSIVTALTGTVFSLA